MREIEREQIGKLAGPLSTVDDHVLDPIETAADVLRHGVKGLDKLPVALAWRVAEVGDAVAIDQAPLLADRIPDRLAGCWDEVDDERDLVGGERFAFWSPFRQVGAAVGRVGLVTWITSFR